MWLPWRLRQYILRVTGAEKRRYLACYTPEFGLEAFSLQLKKATANAHAYRLETIVEHFLDSPLSSALLNSESVIELSAKASIEFPRAHRNLLEYAQRICKRGLPVYNLDLAPLDENFPWDELQAGPLGDQLYLSRPHRFGFAAVLAQSALYDSNYVSQLNGILSGWKNHAENAKWRWPFNSNHAIAYRVISLSWAWTFIAPLYETGLKNKVENTLFNILDVIRCDIDYLSTRLGNSHPNNHLLADYFIGWFLQSLFPVLSKGVLQCDYEDLWLSELHRQFYPDGGNFEHAVHYHEHGCEMALTYFLVKQNLGEMVPEKTECLIENILKFQADLSGATCQAWALGDTTEDVLLPLDASTGWSTPSLSEVYRNLYLPDMLPAELNVEPLKAFWLLGGQISPGSCQANYPQVNVFPDAGFYGFLDQGGANEILFRSGPVERRIFMPGHMHADMLSIYWRYKGLDILAASGTFSYKFSSLSGEGYRNYLCSSSGHSTIILDKTDALGVLKGDFRDRDNGLRVSTEYNFDEERSLAFCMSTIVSKNSYNGVKRCVFHAADHYTLVIDILPRGCAGVERGAGWQFSELTTIRQSSQFELVIKTADANCMIMTSFDISLAVVTGGQENPPLGWISREYGEKSSAPYIFIPYAPDRETFGYVLTSPDSDQVSGLTVDLTDGQLKVEVKGAEFLDILDITLDTKLNDIISFSHN